MIRAATAADLDAVVALERDGLGPDAWPETVIAEGIEGLLPTVTYLVAVGEDGEIGEIGEDGEVLGHAVVSVAGEIAELQRIAVAAGSRRKGLATRLLDAVVAHGRREGADRLLLEVRQDNAGALSFYAARGLVEIDRRPRYYSDGTTAVVMRLPLVKGCG